MEEGFPLVPGGLSASLAAALGEGGAQPAFTARMAAMAPLLAPTLTVAAAVMTTIFQRS